MKPNPALKRDLRGVAARALSSTLGIGTRLTAAIYASLLALPAFAAAAPCSLTHAQLEAAAGRYLAAHPCDRKDCVREVRVFPENCTAEVKPVRARTSTGVPIYAAGDLYTLEFGNDGALRHVIPGK